MGVLTWLGGLRRVPPVNERLRVVVTEASTVEGHKIRRRVPVKLDVTQRRAAADETIGPDAVVIDLRRSAAMPTLWIEIDDARNRKLAALVLTEQVSEGSYDVHFEDDGKTVLMFGDGVRGRRPPKGSQNMVAQYRTGEGEGGDVTPQTITILSDRPQKLPAVTNPVGASGGADPETRAEARGAAPKCVSILDRRVSTRDYEDILLGKGVAKAMAGKRRRKKKQTKHECRVVEIVVWDESLEAARASE